MKIERRGAALKVSFSKGKIIIEPDINEELLITQDQNGDLIISRSN